MLSCKDTMRYYAPGVMVNWEAHHPVTRCALKGFDAYDPLCHNCVGPRSMTRCVRKYSERVTILPQHALYPIGWSDVLRFVRTHSTRLYTFTKMRASFARNNAAQASVLQLQHGAAPPAQAARRLLDAPLWLPA